MTVLTPGARLAIERESAGLTQRDLADRLGVVQSTLSQWETGRRGISIDRLVQIAAILDVPPAAIDPRLKGGP